MEPTVHTKTCIFRCFYQQYLVLFYCGLPYYVFHEWHNLQHTANAMEKIYVAQGGGGGCEHEQANMQTCREIAFSPLDRQQLLT